MIDRARRLRIVVGGYLGLLPAGGVAWDYVQYPAGLAALGHDVYYLEDTRLWPVYQADDPRGADCSENVAYLARVMEDFGLGDRWGYRDEASSRWYGLGDSAAAEVIRTADILVNVSCATAVRDEYRRIPVRALIDSDPMFTQVQATTGSGFTPGAGRMREMLLAHTHHFTFGESVGRPECRVPTAGIAWRHTRQPICLDRWPVSPVPADDAAAFTTLMNWTAAPPLAWGGETWGQKDVEFLRMLELPQRVPEIPLSVAINQTAGTACPIERIRDAGWRVVDPGRVAPDWRSYQQFLADSSGEFSVAKEAYVKARTGWVSCRSACYLAAGRPVVTQDTGWSAHLPAGEGLLAFTGMEDAVDALRRVAREPARHARRAREIAEAHFDSRRVLRQLLAELGG